MATSRSDASDDDLENPEAQRLRRSLIDPDRALAQRRAGDSSRPGEAPPDRRARDAGRESDRRTDLVWVDRGVVETKLDRIDRKEYVGIWEKQPVHKYSEAEVDASLRSLSDVRSRFGKGTSGQEMKALVWSSDPKERQIGKTYMTYYEADPIKVDFEADGKATVANGRHRLARADKLGMDEVPMRVREQRRRRDEGER